MSRKEISLAGIRVPPGEIRHGRLECGASRDSERVFVPLIVVNGMAPGPVLWLGSTIHGRELPGIEVIRRITGEELNPKRLRGALIAAPILNPFAYRASSQHAPEDGLNVHALFPGDPEGSLSSRLANLIFSEGFAKADYVIDLHSNFPPAIQFTIIIPCDDEQIMEQSMGMARAFGFPIARIERTVLPNSLVGCAEDARKPGIIVELLWSDYIKESSVQDGVRGTLNVMKHLEMIDGVIEEQPGLQVTGGPYGRAVVRANQGGIVRFHITPQEVEAGKRVSKGERLATIYDPYGEELEIITSPVDGFVRTLGFGSPPKQTGAEGDVVASFLVIGE